MRTIEKGREPQSLAQHRKSGGTYTDFTQTDDLRHALLREQGHICCFCMRRIVLRGMKIAHWASQSGNPGQKTVLWDNLLGACPGGDGEAREKQHCDTAQGNEKIKVHPADPAQRCERFIEYLPDGTIRSNDAEIHKDVTATLNLNLDSLRLLRKGIYDSTLSRLTKAQPGYWSRAQLGEEVEKWKRRNKDGELREFCQVAIFVLEKKLGKRNL